MILRYCNDFTTRTHHAYYHPRTYHYSSTITHNLVFGSTYNPFLKLKDSTFLQSIHISELDT